MIQFRNWASQIDTVRHSHDLGLSWILPGNYPRITQFSPNYPFPAQNLFTQAILPKNCQTSHDGLRFACLPDYWKFPVTTYHLLKPSNKRQHPAQIWATAWWIRMTTLRSMCPLRHLRNPLYNELLFPIRFPTSGNTPHPACHQPTIPGTTKQSTYWKCLAPSCSQQCSGKNATKALAPIWWRWGS
jgi:hypothetical protein